MTKHYHKAFAPLAEFQSQRAEFALTPTQKELMEETCEGTIRDSEGVCVFDFVAMKDGKVKSASDDDDEEEGDEDEERGDEHDHMEDLYEYCELEVIEKDMEAGTILPFAVLNILGTVYPYANAFQETSNHGMLCFDFRKSKDKPSVVWVASGAVHPFAPTPESLKIKLNPVEKKKRA